MSEGITIALLVLLPILTLMVIPIILLVMSVGAKGRMEGLRNEQQRMLKKIDMLRDRVDQVLKGAPPKEAPAPAEKLKPVESVQPKEVEPVVTELVPEKAEIKMPVAAKAVKTPAPPALPTAPAKKVVWDTKPPEILQKAAAQQSKLAESVGEVLGKIWNWVLVGDRSENVTTEFAVATTWLVRAGILLFAFGAAFLLKWSSDKNLIPDVARVAMCMVAGVVMVVAGIKLLGKKYDLIGQGLLGGGLLVLYFSCYAAGPGMYRLVPTPVAFLLMILVTIAAGMLSVRTDSLLIAIIGIAGGYLTPVLISTGSGDLPVLYSYMLLLGVCILAISHYKQWRLLNYIGFVATYVLFWSSYLKYYEIDQHFVLALSFLTGFFVIHSSIVFIHNILRKEKSTILEIIHLVLNATIYAWWGYWLVRNAHDRFTTSLVTIGLAIFFIGHVLVFLKKKIVDRNLLIALIALAGTFTALTLPLLLEKESLTICLSLMGLMFLWMGYKLNSNFVRNCGYILYMVVFFRLLVLDMPRNFSGNWSSETAASVYWQQMRDRLMTFGISILSVIGGFFMEKLVGAEKDLALARDNDMPDIVKANVANQIFYWFSILFTFLFMNLEVNRMFVYFDPIRLPALTVLWCAMAGYFLWRYVSGKSGGIVMFAAMCVCIVVAFLKVFSVDLHSWHLSEGYIYDMDYSLLFVGMRFMDFGVVMLMLMTIWLVLPRRGDRPKNSVAAFGYLSLLLIFVYATLEVNSYLHWCMEDFLEGGISVLWALFAIAFTVCGIWKNVKPLRFIGLGIFTVVAGKIIFYDLRDMEMIHRVIAFMVLGVTMLLGAFAYIFSNKKFEKQ
jgi:uncharacterized membrane protein